MEVRLWKTTARVSRPTPSDVLKYYYRGADVEGSVVIRPSGTEPKLKAYISVTAEDKTCAETVEHNIAAEHRKTAIKHEGALTTALVFFAG
jgi:phosphomannomutase